ncbi:hypothetical protein M433DRAFT_156242 [Acidomyces richmondensis BFW]|nr:MAG: hypothetical protein FE78DRAFT_93453 [Acidomyces sp. 'richmondensis']KYG43864.1 hypothetical protein M433DRAFT_156242 [Acidomyces richmondensis BFW]
MPYIGSDNPNYHEIPRRRRARYPSPSDSSYDSQHAYESREQGRGYKRKNERKQATLSKASIAFGFLSIVAGLIQLWITRVSAETEPQMRRQRERDFEKRKSARRKYEEECEQQADREDAVRDLRRHVIRQIEYKPQERSRSRSQARRKIDAPLRHVQNA